MWQGRHFCFQTSVSISKKSRMGNSFSPDRLPLEGQTGPTENRSVLAYGRRKILYPTTLLTLRLPLSGFEGSIPMSDPMEGAPGAGSFLRPFRHTTYLLHPTETHHPRFSLSFPRCQGKASRPTKRRGPRIVYRLIDILVKRFSISLRSGLDRELENPWTGCDCRTIRGTGRYSTYRNTRPESLPFPPSFKSSGTRRNFSYQSSTIPFEDPAF
jgi:hypothetical protein